MLLIDIDLTDSSNIIILLSSIGSIIVAFFFLRQLNLWYWRIDNSIKNQEEQIRLLKILAGEGEGIITWECTKCEHKNPNTTYQCSECDYSLK